MFAAAGLYALEHVAPRLAWDHTHARAIAQGETGEEKLSQLVICC